MKTVKNSAHFARQGWYPEEEAPCKRAIRKFLEEEKPSNSDEMNNLRAGIVPHAGWDFSGGPAARVFKALSSGDSVRRVVLFGGHMGPESRGWILMEGIWETPVGPIEQDAEFAEKLASLAGKGFSKIGPDDYRPDNTIELQLPFIGCILEGAKVVVAGVPAAHHGLELGRCAAEAAIGIDGDKAEQRTVVVGSTDLTHYGLNYGFMERGLGKDAVTWVKQENDARALKHIRDLDAREFLDDALKSHNACCPGAAGAAISAAKAMGSEEGLILEYFTSYDVHPGPSFVGYGAAVM